MIEEDIVVIGTLGKPRGVHGEILVQPLTDFPERFVKMKEVMISTRNGSWETVKIEQSHLVSGRPVLKLSGIETPEAAARLTNRQLAVHRSDVVKLPKGRFYIFDVVGCLAFDDLSGELIGEVVDVITAPANDAYAIRTADGRTLLAAAVSTIVRSVDTTARKIIVNSGGLFDEQGAGPKDEI
ncbi:MAG: ribosome maturation factor RimM [Candidatus Zixiibacteriota bacterium]